MEHCRRKARLLKALLAAHRASEADSSDEALDRALRFEAALALDRGDAQLTTLLHHLDLAERRLPRTGAAVKPGGASSGRCRRGLGSTAS